ncbi:phosphatase [Vulcanimicrobium alpinum]|uniref:Phosphatase n=1 Tax=Vulcanimicrobium alpinum TaxID=3016050 RepID=A0AAN1XVD0_UNVUL|nr:DAK2 domain-containing protein [Vulcanimicrobium alpinum]BDE06138.1 phosphatase [Vulcanimicrobium alpinum]
MAVTHLDGRAFERFVAAGTYFLRKYRGVLNDLNVFPVPDGDTGSNMFLTAKAALREASKVRDQELSTVAAAAANGSLLGARGNSGVILSQMLRGFSHSVRHRSSIDTFQLSLAMKEAVAAARAALTKPVEGTILTVAGAAADEAYRLAVREPDFYRLANAVLRAANDALERTPEQLPALKEAGVVDSGGAGFCYFLEGALRFLPEATVRATAFPRRPTRSAVFTRRQAVGEYRFCTEFVLEDANVEAYPLRDQLEKLGDSLLVIGAKPTIKVHVHTAEPETVKAIAARYGAVTRWKVEDMARQHTLLVVDAPLRPVGIAAVVAGPGFDRIARELGADVTIPTPAGANPSVQDLLVAANAALASTVYLLPNDSNVALAAREVPALTDKRVVIVPTRDPVAGLAMLLRLAGADEPVAFDRLTAALEEVRSASVFFAGKDSSVGGVAVQRGAPTASIGGRLITAPALNDLIVETAAQLGAGDGGLITLYYGNAQKERDAQRLAATLAERFAGIEVEYYYGGQPAIEYWISYE